jgi:glycine/D-amino acid oxidase-like deaminating enzyme
MERYDVVIIGGGFFGCSLALHVKKADNKVLILEKESDLMLHASYNNQARVHGGYHYSRSLLTALRSRVNLDDFMRDYGVVVDSSFDKYYAISRTFSKVSARHFFLFCKRIGAEIEAAPANVKKLFNDDLIEDVFKVREYAFDSLKLRKIIHQQLDEAGVEYRFQTEAESIQSDGDDIILTLQDLASGSTSQVRTPRLFNCAYSHINKLNHNSNLPFSPLKHELTEMALVEVPDELQNVGITVMDGPFFSIMPFPPRGLHTLSHVRYTPHVEWHDHEGSWRNGHQFLQEHKPTTAYAKMAADAQRYVPAIKKTKYVDSLWEVKTVLTASEQDDSRPILFSANHGGIKGYTVVMGGKIDNIRDVLMEVSK